MQDIMSFLTPLLIRAVVSSLVTGIGFFVLRLFMNNLKLMLIILGIGWLIVAGIIPMSFIHQFV